MYACDNCGIRCRHFASHREEGEGHAPATTTSTTRPAVLMSSSSSRLNQCCALLFGHKVPQPTKEKKAKKKIKRHTTASTTCINHTTKPTTSTNTLTMFSSLSLDDLDYIDDDKFDQQLPSVDRATVHEQQCSPGWSASLDQVQQTCQLICRANTNNMCIIQAHLEGFTVP